MFARLVHGVVDADPVVAGLVVGAVAVFAIIYVARRAIGRAARPGGR